MFYYCCTLLLGEVYINRTILLITVIILALIFGGKITNSPKIKASQAYVQSEEEIKSSVDLPKFNASNSKRARVNSNNSESNYSVIVNTKPDIQGVGGGGGSSSPIFASKGDKNVGTSSFMVGTSNNQLFANESNNTTSVIQKGTQGVSDVVDPGGGDPGNMIPVGNGLPVLLAFAMIYFIYKRTFLKD